MSLTFRILTSETAADNAGEIVLRLAGRIDREADSAIDSAWSAVAETPIVEIDFTDVDYINSTGIALIVGFLARARSNGVAVRAAGLTPHYQHIFEITRLSDFMDIVEPAAS